MFTRRHERELAEIKALTFELGQRFEEVLEQLEDIKEGQERLATQNQNQGAGKAQRKADRVQTEAPGLKAVGGKKARNRQGSTPVVGAAVKPGKQGRASAVASGEDLRGGDDARKRGKKARRKQRRSEASASAGSDEEPGSGEEQSGEESRPASP
jgi:hypothetical protein